MKRQTFEAFIKKQRLPWLEKEKMFEIARL